MAEGEQEVGDDVERHAGTYQVDEVTPVDELPCGEAVQNEPCRDECVEPAGTSDAEFFSIECDVVRNRPVGEPHEDEVYELRDGAGKEEPVERERCVGLLFLGGDFEGLHQDEADDAQDDGNREDDGVAEGFVQEHACHGARSESEVHAHAEVSDAFAAAA